MNHDTEEDDSPSLTTPVWQPTMAVCHYRNGRFAKANEEFEFGLTQSTSKKRPREENLLARLAWQADAALCRARSSNNPLRSTFQEAIEINQQYRTTLQQSCDCTATSDSNCDDRQQQQQQQREMVTSFLLATVTAIWLHLRMDQLTMAYHVVWESLQWAVTILLHVMDGVWAYDEALEHLSKVMILPKQVLVLKQLRHAISLLHLASQQDYAVVTLPTPDSRSDKHDNDKYTNEVVSDEDFTTTTTALQVQDLLVKALAWHRLSQNGDSTARCERNACLARASSLETDGTMLTMARKIEALLLSSDETTDVNMVIQSTLKHVISRSSPAEVNFHGYKLARCSGNLDDAFTSFQNALALTDSNGSSELHQDIVSNLAECRLLQGEPCAAKDLLLYLIHASPDVKLTAHPSTRYEITTRQSPRVDRPTEFLWRAFCAASLDYDPVPVMALAEMLLEKEQHHDTIAAATAHVFALMQGQRPSLALNVCRQQDRTKSMDHASKVVFDLYEADAALNTESGFNPLCSTRGVSNVLTLTESAVTNLCSLPPVVNGISPKISTLSIAVYNNRGMAHLMAGNVACSLDCFRAAVEYSSSTPVHLRNLHPYMNLCLLLWKERRFQEAVDVWLPVRGVVPSVDSVRVALSSAIGCYVSVVSSSEKEGWLSHVPKWQPRGIRGTDPTLVHLMDCLMLQCTLEIVGDATLKSQMQSILLSSLTDNWG